MDMRENPRAFHKYVNSKNNGKEPLPTLKKNDGTTTQDDKETAQDLLDYFSSVHIEENDRDLLYAGSFFNDLYLPHNYNDIVAENTIEDFEINKREVLED